MEWLDRNKEVQKYIFTRIAGVTFPNRDGSSRQVALCECKPLDKVMLKWEQNNPVSKTAIAVCREDGQQLGYLNSRLGDETFRRLNKGELWIGLFVSATVAAPDHEVLGATILIVKVKRQKF